MNAWQHQGAAASASLLPLLLLQVSTSLERKHTMTKQQLGLALMFMVKPCLQHLRLYMNPASLYKSNTILVSFQHHNTSPSKSSSQMPWRLIIGITNCNGVQAFYQTTVGIAMVNTFSLICISGCTSASTKWGMIWCLESSGYAHPSQWSF